MFVNTLTPKFTQGAKKVAPALFWAICAYPFTNIYVCDKINIVEAVMTPDFLLFRLGKDSLLQAALAGDASCAGSFMEFAAKYNLQGDIFKAYIAYLLISEENSFSLQCVVCWYIRWIHMNVVDTVFTSSYSFSRTEA